jgi:hypothetical protein
MRSSWLGCRNRATPFRRSCEGVQFSGTTQPKSQYDVRIYVFIGISTGPLKYEYQILDS